MDRTMQKTHTAAGAGERRNVKIYTLHSAKLHIDDYDDDDDESYGNRYVLGARAAQIAISLSQFPSRGTANDTMR